MTVVRATILFRSRWAGSLDPASNKPITAKELAKRFRDGDSARVRVRYSPKTPTLTMYPLSNIENSTEASTWALSNHDVAGHKGTFTPNPTKKQKPVREPHLGDRVSPIAGPPIRPNPVSNPALPTRVHMNISNPASLTLSDLDVRRSIKSALSNKNSNETNISQRLVVDINTRPEARLTRPAKAVGPITVIGLDWDSIKKGKLATTSAPKTPTSIASQPLWKQATKFVVAACGVLRLQVSNKAAVVVYRAHTKISGAKALPAKNFEFRPELPHESPYRAIPIKEKSINMDPI